MRSSPTEERVVALEQPAHEELSNIAAVVEQQPAEAPVQYWAQIALALVGLATPASLMLALDQP